MSENVEAICVILFYKFTKLRKKIQTKNRNTLALKKQLFHGIVTIPMGRVKSVRWKQSDDSFLREGLQFKNLEVRQ